MVSQRTKVQWNEIDIWYTSDLDAVKWFHENSSDLVVLMHLGA